MSDLVNTQLGQYELIEAIGHGGMATVYKAYQASLDRHVAVKVLLSNRDPQFAVRFKREARAIAALQHHNILPIYDYGEQNGLLYFVLQYVENGSTLHQMLGRPMPPAQALRLIGHVLAALNYAHERGVIHRDIKPGNILMPTSNWALLADFGIAKLMNDSQHLTMTGIIIGTAAYMAPEQAAGRAVDARTDLYSLGVVLYEMMTGRVPFEAETPVAVLTQHVYEPPPPPRTLNPDLAPEIEAVLLRVLAKDPGQRYQSAAEMAAEVDRVARRLDRWRPSGQVISMYQAGVDAFQKGRWDEAVDRFSNLVALAPDYEDATMLLNAARLAHEQTSQARAIGGPGGYGPPPADQTVKARPAVDQTLMPSITNRLPEPAASAAATPPPSARAATLPADADVGAEQPARPNWLLWAAIGAVALLLSGIGGAYRLGFFQQSIEPGAAAAIVQATTTSSPTPTGTSAPAPAAVSAATEPPTSTSTSLPSPTPTATLAPTEAPPATPAPNAVVGIEKLNLRAGPGEQYPNTGSYVQGTALKVTGKEPTGTWLQIEAPDGQAGWMLAEYLQVNLNLADVPAVATPPPPKPTATPTRKPTAKPAPKPAAPAAPPAEPTATAEPPMAPTAPPAPTATPAPPPTNTPKPHHGGGGGGGGGGGDAPPPSSP